MFIKPTKTRSQFSYHTKGKTLVFLFFCFTAFASYAQKPLTNSRQSSFYTYIYKLTPQDVLNFYKFPDKEPEEKILKNPVDSFKTDDHWDNHLPAGNYMKVYADKNELVYKLIENHSAFLQALRNNLDSRFIITDSLGTKIDNAKVLVNNRPARFDTKTNSFYTKLSANTLVEVDYKGVANFYQLQTNKSYTRKFLSANWFKYQGYKLKRLFAEKDNGNYNNRYKFRERLETNDKYTGFMVFNKPKYKPLDTVKLKAFIIDRKTKKPVKISRLLVRVQERYDDNGKIIGFVNSYREGGFEYNFVLADSLKLSLDDDYFISLEAPSSAKYDLDKNNAEKDDDEFLYKRKVYIAGKFTYEDYELKTTTFNLRTDKKEHTPGDPLSIYLKATDENDLPVQDGRVELKLFTSRATSYKSDKVFVPDTLWRYKLTLEPLGETKVTVPDSIFPKADIEYHIEADFLNSDNEHLHQSRHVNFKYENYKIKADLSFDTLKINGLLKGRNVKMAAKINAVNYKGDTVSKSKITLPEAIIVNPYIKNYIVEADSAVLNINMRDFENELDFAGYQTADSLFIKVNNPRRIHFWYWLIGNNHLIDGGVTDSLFYKKKSFGKVPVTFSMSYYWGGENKLKGLAIPYQDKLLNIKVKQPVSVYPGQQVKTEFEVKDAVGRPVADADITAWAITRKFPDYRAPFVPYLGKSYPGLKSKPYVSIRNSDKNGVLLLNWARWGREMGLDSIAYYRFTHPTDIFKIEEPAPDSVTQIAPFVVKRGNITAVHILYIDERPVYFDQAQQLQRYSFITSPGWHSLRFRTRNETIKLDSAFVEKGKKLILSINDDTLFNKTVHFTKMPDSLTNYEANLLNNYLIRVVDNFDSKMATLEQDDHIFLLNPNPSEYYRHNEILTGPLLNNHGFFSIKGELTRFFLAEPGYSYLFEPGLIKQKSISTKYPFNVNIFNRQPTTDYTQYALTKKETERMWQRYLDLRSHTTPLFTNDPVSDKVTGKLEIIITNAYKLPLIKTIIIYRDNNPDFIRIFPGNETHLGLLAPGSYRLFFLLEDNGYCVMNNINIKPHGLNFYRVNIAPQPKDAVSAKIDSVISHRTGKSKYDDSDIKNDALKLKEAFNNKYVDKATFKNMMEGRVISSDDKLPIPGCSVKVKGTSYATNTDLYGRFSIKVPSSGTLMFSFIGYETRQIPISPESAVEIQLDPSKQSLNEVVVVSIGYGTQRRADLTGSVSLVTTNSSIGLINIRGIGTMADAKPLIVVDGIIVDSMDSIDPANIGEITNLKNTAATAIYGSRGANGVILITTKKKNGLQLPGDSNETSDKETLRKNFSDYAYWHPKLTTDENGKASFTTTFPDDITNWRTFVIGINDNRQTGFADNSIKSFKPLSASLISPLFAVQGDELSLMGKVLNYSTTPANITRTFSYNDKLLKQDAFEVKNSKIDTLHVMAGKTDSLTFEYSIKRDNGYFDGERHKIPVIEQGVKETKGIFAALNGDTTVNMQFDAAPGTVTLGAEASVLPALADEAQHLRDYKYLCNEQLASKLKGLLAEKRIRTYLGQPFKYERTILEVIKKLQENRRSQGTWGWWKDTNEELWISLHAIEALTDAKKEGYIVTIDFAKLTDYLVYQLESYKGEEKLACLQLLHKLNAKVDYSRYFAVITKELSLQKQPDKYDLFRLMLLQTEMGQPAKMDSLWANKRRTLFGNIYWGNESYRFFENPIQLSVLAYKIIKNEGKHPELLEKIRGYFLEQRRTGEWRNTYESSLILETILPDLLTESKQVKPAKLVIKGLRTDTVSAFPYTTTLTDKQLTVSKTGSLPVYITGYQQFWNPKPEKASRDFMVDTWFEKKGEKINILKGGEAVLLKAEITVKGDADYVMIEIPIPAGCSYESKEQSWQNNEVHREYFKEKVCIFCRKLKQGKYGFEVNLMPRYDGKYNLNPTKAEMMYFPVFYGREGMKKVQIGE